MSEVLQFPEEQFERSANGTLFYPVRSRVSIMFSQFCSLGAADRD
jgi:hypothetical protein